MKKIKSFKLFESAPRGVRLEDNIEGMWELYEDIKSIEYIVEEAGYNIIYNFMFKDRKYDAYLRSLTSSSVLFLIENNIPIGKFISINIEVAYPKDQVIVNAGGQIRLTPEQIEKIGVDCERYCNLLKEHLDYVKSVERHSGGTGKNVIVVKL
jgi:hypothetical protein